MSNYRQFKLECEQEISVMADDGKLADLSQEWIIRVNEKKYSYHFEWLGRPIIQYPQDMIAVQELIWQVQPDLIIETGIAHGGSLIMSASLLAMLDYCDAAKANKVLDPRAPQRKVIGIDIDIRAPNRQEIEQHPMFSRIEMIEGSSIEPEIIKKVKKVSEGFNRILVILDSNHTHEHVLAELKAYASLAAIGSYCIVFDTVIEDFPANAFPERAWGKGNNPKTAVWEYLKEHSEYMIDRQIQDKLLVTVAPDGYLKRVK